MYRVAAALLLTTGCSLHYDVTLTPDGEQLHRTTVVDVDIEPTEVDALRRQFGAPKHSDTSKNEPIRLIFSGSHAGPDWADGFGGRGSWTTYESPLGSTQCFLECLGGDVNVLDDLLALQNGIDAIASRIRRALRTELQGDPMLRPAIRLLDKRIAPDVRDAAVLGWALLFSSKVLPGKDLTGTGPGRSRLLNHVEKKLQEAAIAFLWQRNWLTASEASLLATGQADINDLGERILARALGLDGEWKPRLLDFQERIDAIFTDDFNAELTQAFIKAVGPHTRLAVAWAATSAILTSRTVTISLTSATPPTTTNGHWQDGVIEWELDSAPFAAGLTAPPLCWAATWATPDESAQARVLGHTDLEANDLVEFTLLWTDASKAQRSDATDIIESFAKARRGTEIRASGTDLLAECRRVLRP
jgi:hypothetical protein